MVSPLGWLYGKIINQRNASYDRGTLKSHYLGAPTISVGNITVGGTGKTPLVVHIAEILAEQGEKVCIISRGYKRENEKEQVLVSDGKGVLADVRKTGDEPFVLASKLTGKAVVIANPDRVEAAKWALDNFEVTVFLLDDGFQHRKAKRDLDIVVIDATDPFGNLEPLPSGILREPIENLARGDLFVITRGNLVESVSEVVSEIRKHNQSSPIILSENVTAKTTRLSDFISGTACDDEYIRTKCLAFCALGNPENFFNQLKKSGFEVSSTRAFSDHHSYLQRDVEKLEKIALQNSAEAFLTTAKDAVKLRELEFNIPCFVVESRLAFDNEKKLREKIYAVFES